jgi:hypothetical protein
MKINVAKEIILKGKYTDIDINKLSGNYEDLEDLLTELAFDTGSISILGFINYLIINQPNAFFYYLASKILVTGLVHIEGAYPTAFFYATQAEKLEPDDFSYKEHLLLFFSCPEKLLDQVMAKTLAKQILLSDPNNIAAKQVLEESGL